jgi:hypothetical protein
MIPEELRQYATLVVAVVSLNHRVNGAVEQLKADMQLIDGSRLHDERGVLWRPVAQIRLLSSHTDW